MRQGASQPGMIGRFLASFGAPMLYVWREFSGIWSTGRLTLYYMLRGRIRWREVVAQSFEIGNRSVVFISFTLGFLGMILIFRPGSRRRRSQGICSCSAPCFFSCSCVSLPPPSRL